MQRALNDSWYNAFATPREAASPAAEQTAVRSLTHGDRQSERPTNDHTLPTVLSAGAEEQRDLGTLVLHQTKELERLAQENLRLMDRIESFLELQHREQVLRQQLQNQVDRLTANLERTAEPALDRSAVLEEARIGVTEEVKPVLLAIVELLERSLSRSAEAPVPTSVAEAQPAEPEPTASPAAYEPLDADDAAPVQKPAPFADDEPPASAGAGPDDNLGLPEILTRPLADLTDAPKVTNLTPAPAPSEPPPAPAVRAARAIAGLFR
ncbi:MAG TPA: hypothetical protein VLL72_04645 [Kiloniellales bacterium]|nr:hypothetical protein [Kiloniellales bacterium]